MAQEQEQLTGVCWPRWALQTALCEARRRRALALRTLALAEARGLDPQPFRLALLRGDMLVSSLEWRLLSWASH